MDINGRDETLELRTDVPKLVTHERHVLNHAPQLLPCLDRDDHDRTAVVHR